MRREYGDLVQEPQQQQGEEYGNDYSSGMIVQKNQPQQPQVPGLDADLENVPRKSLQQTMQDAAISLTLLTPEERTSAKGSKQRRTRTRSGQP